MFIVCLAESRVSSRIADNFVISESELVSRHSTNQIPGHTAKTTAQSSTEFEELELPELLEQEQPAKVKERKQHCVNREDDFSIFL